MKLLTIFKNFEIIGEAAYHLTKDLREQTNDTKDLREQTNDKVEWRKIIAFRHIIVHDYWDIDLETVWNSKENKLEHLAREVKEMLSQL